VIRRPSYAGVVATPLTVTRRSVAPVSSRKASGERASNRIVVRQRVGTGAGFGEGQRHEPDASAVGREFARSAGRG
jgi:hypothetical protein